MFIFSKIVWYIGTEKHNDGTKKGYYNYYIFIYVFMMILK